MTQTAAKPNAFRTMKVDLGHLVIRTEPSGYELVMQICGSAREANAYRQQFELNERAAEMRAAARK